jgi:hypothetical protein
MKRYKDDVSIINLLMDSTVALNGIIKSEFYEKK